MKRTSKASSLDNRGWITALMQNAMMSRETSRDASTTSMLNRCNTGVSSSMLNGVFTPADTVFWGVNKLPSPLAWHLAAKLLQLRFLPRLHQSSGPWLDATLLRKGTTIFQTIRNGARWFAVHFLPDWWSSPSFLSCLLCILLENC